MASLIYTQSREAAPNSKDDKGQRVGDPVPKSFVPYQGISTFHGDKWRIQLRQGAKTERRKQHTGRST